MTDTTFVYVLWAVCCVLYVLSGIRRHRRLKQLEEWAALHAPLTGAAAVSSRLDGALRDAEDGFNTCDVCGFENLKRRIFCLLCGTPVGVEELSVRSPQRLTSRQQRARLRKEWQRRLNDDGELQWVRAEPRSGWATMATMPAYKLEFRVQLMDEVAFEKEEKVAAELPEEVTSEKPDVVDGVAPMDASSSEQTPQSSHEHLDDDTDVDGDRQEVSGSEEVATTGSHEPPSPKLHLKPLEDVDAEIHAQLRSSSMRLLDAARADPSQLSIEFVQSESSQTSVHEDGDPQPEPELESELPQRKAEKKAFIHDANLPFPSKLVQFIAHATAVQRPVTADTNTASSIAKIQLRVDRNRLLSDSILTLAGLPLETVKLGFRIAFLGETAVDAGGVYREWLFLVNEAILSPEAGIFACVDLQDQAFYLNPFSKEALGENHLAHVLAAGRLLGRALLEGNVTGFHLALPLLKIILGQPVSFHDLEYFDPQLHKNLRWLLENDDVESLGLDFTIQEQLPDGTTRLVELVPHGREIDLTDRNKRAYVDRKLKYLLFERVQDQLFAFLKGLHEVVPMDLLMLFDAEELDYVLSGSDEIDVDDWERNTRYTANLIDQPVRQWFWDIVREMPNEHRRRLLQFSTGASRVPLAGFSGLTSYDGRLCPFTLKGVSLHHEQYLRSHACFNQLDLPIYESKSQLATMLAAVTADDSSAHGFTIV